MQGRGCDSGLLERSEPLGAIGKALDRAAAGSGRVVLVEGPAGIGKTSLLRAATENAPGLLRTSGGAIESEIPMGGLRELLAPGIERLGPASRQSVLEGPAGLAAQLFAPDPAPLPPDAIDAVPHAVYRLVANLSELDPLVLAVDDAHLLDRESLRALAYLSARSAELPIAILIVRRSGQDGRVGELEQLLDVAPELVTIELGPLSREATASLVGGAFDDPHTAFSDACHELTGGSPYLLAELLRTLKREGVDADQEGALRVGELVPETVSRDAALRLQRLGPHARALAEAVAVLERAGTDLAAALAGLAPDLAEDAALQLVGAGLLVDAVPLVYEHSLVRAAVLEEVAQPKLERMHREAARLLLSRPGGTDRAGAHLLETLPRGEAWARDALTGAAQDALGRGAIGGATRLLRRALEEGPSPAPAELLALLGGTRLAAGDPGGAEDLTAALAGAGPPREAAAITATLAAAELTSGRSAVGIRRLQRALGRASPGSEEEALLLGAFPASAYPGIATTARERLPAAVSGEEAWVPALSAQRLFADVLAGDVEASEIATVAQRLLGADSSLIWAGAGPPPPTLTAFALIAAEQFETAEPAIAELLAQARDSGSQLLTAMVLVLRAWSAWVRGEPRHAVAHGEACLALIPPGAWIHPEVPARRAICDGLIDLGRLEDAEAALEPAIRMVGDGSHGMVSAWGLDAASRLALARGRAAEALELAERAGAITDAVEARAPVATSWQRRGALAALALGEASKARALAEAAVASAETFGAPVALGSALRVRALTSSGTERIEGLERAAGVLRTTPGRLELARTLCDLGSAMRTERLAKAAREPLRIALDLASALGVALAGRAEAELRAAGGRPRRPRSSGLAGLTGRELEVAELAAGGLTNREIAETLFLSAKTVESHLGSVFRKLSVPGRAELGPCLRGAEPEGSTPDRAAH